MVSDKKMNKIYTILKRHRGMFYNLDYWRVTLNIELGNKNWSMNNNHVAQLLAKLYRRGEVERQGVKGRYLYKIK